MQLFFPPIRQNSMVTAELVLDLLKQPSGPFRPMKIRSRRPLFRGGIKAGLFRPLLCFVGDLDMTAMSRVVEIGNNGNVIPRPLVPIAGNVELATERLPSSHQRARLFNLNGQ